MCLHHKATIFFLPIAMRSKFSSTYCYAFFFTKDFVSWSSPHWCKDFFSPFPCSKFQGHFLLIQVFELRVPSRERVYFYLIHVSRFWFPSHETSLFSCPSFRIPSYEIVIFFLVHVFRVSSFDFKKHGHTITF